MSWEMAMARALISSRPQILWDPARGQETGAHRDAKWLLDFIVREGGDLTVIPGCECWHCQEPRAGWGRGSGREARKIHFSFQGT